MLDLMLKLSPNTRLQSFQIVSEFPQYDELLQRAVTILLLSNERTYFVDGEPIYIALEKSNATGIDNLTTAVESMGKYLKSQLEEDDPELELDSLNITLMTEGRRQSIVIDIVRADGTTINGEVALS